MITIKLGNKVFYTLIALVAVMVIAGLAFAWNSGNPAVHGHSANEVAGMEDVMDAVFGSSDSCGSLTVIFNSSKLTTHITSATPWMDGNKYTEGKKTVPDACIGSTCTIKQEIYSRASTTAPLTLKLFRFYTYNQDSASGIWSSSYAAIGNKNGDDTSSDIVPIYDSSRIMIKDDFKVLPEPPYTNETNRSQWTFIDRSTTYDQVVYLCIPPSLD
jgi:hypothetical protein